VAVASKTFWYKVMDLMHYGQMHLTSPARGYMVFTKRDWACCFYKGDQTTAADRAWERFKSTARRASLFSNLPGDAAEKASSVPSSNATLLSERVVIRVNEAQDALYTALGPPHAAGPAAQVRCERERRQKLLPLIVLGIAAAARVEQRRLVG